MHSLVDDLIDVGHFAPADRDRVVSTIVEAARRNQFTMKLTMYAAVGTAPST